MRRRDFLAGTALAAVGCSTSTDEAEPVGGPIEEAARLIQSQVDEGRLIAATLAVHDGNKVYHGAFGEARSDEAIFLIASISKPMTATGVMLLADLGELSLSDPVVKYIPEFSEGDRKLVTIEHLLTHTSGLPDQLPNNNELRAAHAPLSEFVAEAVKAPLKFKPGEEYSYQSMGILLAAEAAQRITGQRFRDFLAAEIFEPLGMNRTVLGLVPFAMDEVMTSQVEFAAPEGGAGDPLTRAWDWNSAYWRDLGAPWGGVHSTAVDIERFLRSFLEPDGHVLKPETIQAMRTNHTSGLSSSRGLGWQMGARFAEGCSEATYGHGGSTGTSCWCDPERGLSFVILTTLPARASRQTILGPAAELVSQTA